MYSGFQAAFLLLRTAWPHGKNALILGRYPSGKKACFFGMGEACLAVRQEKHGQKKFIANPESVCLFRANAGFETWFDKQKKELQRDAP